MKNSNCGNCPHLHRCRATNNDECIDTIIGRKHYMSNREKQIRADAIDEFVEMLTNEWGLDIILAQSNRAKLKSFIVSNAEQMKEQK